MLFPKTGSSPNHQFSGFLLLVSGRGNTVIHYKFKGVNTTWWLEIFGSSFGSSQKIAWLRCVFGEISHLDFHFEKNPTDFHIFFECINKYFYDSSNLLWPKVRNKKRFHHQARTFNTEAWRNCACWVQFRRKLLVGQRWCFWRPWWKSRSWNIFENATSKVLRMCRLGGRCKWGCWLFGGGWWMIVDICQDGCFWGVGFDAIRDLSIFASWLYSAVSNLWVGVTFLLTIPMVTRLTRWRFFWCQGNLCLLGWSFLQRIAQKCGSC